MPDEETVEPLPTPHSPKYELVKGYWDRLIWNETRLRNAVLKEWITAAEFEEITGIAYSTPDQGRSSASV